LFANVQFKSDFYNEINDLMTMFFDIISMTDGISKIISKMIAKKSIIKPEPAIN
jgi:hypothetical protein